MSKYLLFLDESGDHGLKTIDPNFPIFVLTGLLFSEDSYKNVCKQVNEFKNKFFKTTAVNLHRRDMRKYERGFEILFDAEVKKRFYSDLNKILSEVTTRLLPQQLTKKNI